MKDSKYKKGKTNQKKKIKFKKKYSCKIQNK